MIIMAAGVSSRMKASMNNSNLSDEQILQSNNIAKGFIRIGKKDETMIYHIIKNSIASKISDFFIILSKYSIEFHSYLIIRDDPFSPIGCSLCCVSFE